MSSLYLKKREVKYGIVAERKGLSFDDDKFEVLFKFTTVSKYQIKIMIDRITLTDL